LCVNLTTRGSTREWPPRRREGRQPERNRSSHLPEGALNGVVTAAPSVLLNRRGVHERQKVLAQEFKEKRRHAFPNDEPDQVVRRGAYVLLPATALGSERPPSEVVSVEGVDLHRLSQRQNPVLCRVQFLVAAWVAQVPRQRRRRQVGFHAL